MANPFFHYINNNRNSSDRSLFSSFLEPVKEYHSAKKIALSKPPEIAISISELLKNRMSNRCFKNKALSLEDLSLILYWSMSEAVSSQESPKSDKQFVRRPYPSGGAKFPVEAYVVTDSHESLGTALYHYRPNSHDLEKVKSLTDVEMLHIKEGYKYEFVAEIPVLVLFSYIMERNVPKYGSFGVKLALIEAGHIAQNISLTAQSQGVDSIMLAGGDFDAMDSLFGFDSYNESTFYSVGLGRTYGIKT